MIFYHTADIHLGAKPDSGRPWSLEREKALWSTFSNITREAGRSAKLLLIAGDLFHRPPLRSELNEVCGLFEDIPHTHVVIIAGNHDYIGSGSLYRSWKWPGNVTLLATPELSSVYLEDINTEVHGLSYLQPEITSPLLDSASAPRDGRKHILLAHCGDANHIPFRPEKAAEAGFDYIAMGHIHQPKRYNGIPAAMCGSPEPLDRTDMGERGYVVGDLNDTGCSIRWVQSATAQYTSLTLKVSSETTTTQLLNHIRSYQEKNPAYICRLKLIGLRRPDILFDLDMLLDGARITDIIDSTVPDLDISRLSYEHKNDIIGHFIKQLQMTDISEEKRRKALEYGLRALMEDFN
jgi:DNA repair exonuclease SbcCD nuclease subunit